MARSKNKGEKNGNAKLTEKKVIKIIKLRGKRPQSAVANQFKVSVGLVGAIMRREVWSHVRVPRA